MTLAESLRADFAYETKATRAVLTVVPEDRLAWQPHEKSMTLGRLAGHIAESPGWAHPMIGQDVLDFATVGDSYSPFTATSSAELLTTFEQQNSSFDALLEGQSDEHLRQPWAIHNGEQVLVQMPRAEALRTWVLHHIIHHRGQLSVYLRLLDVPLPGIYGGTADNPGFS